MKKQQLINLVNIAFVGSIISISACSPSRPVADATTMQQAWEEFANPADSTRTKVWWFHGETETTREGITADLEAYKRAGVGGVVYYDQVHGKVRMLSMPFRKSGGKCCVSRHPKQSAWGFRLR